ncbi:MAG: hypothetical protein ACXV5S_00625 [Acidimicrobiales bacterium]
MGNTDGVLWALFPIYGGYTALTDGVTRSSLGRRAGCRDDA